ncbi:hypothetical protein [Aeromicrobium sp. Leaf291]|uniref:hypothetical protein n=1 Tax=Aeromicrobium sp. Leaf291 TaxID=1736325 RepID=UPI000B0E3697|nr:hypothetical protein [Aeromicrobium sp. Leaf291]
MRWDFEPDAVDGLKLIGMIPDLSPCLLEGRNGIGKTVSVQLLELISGAMPPEFIERPELWTSLKKRLGNTKVIGTELIGAKSIEFVFTPERWLDSPAVDMDRLGDARIDGESAAGSEAAALISVERIAGNEDLADTVARHRDLLQGQLAAVGRQLRRRNDDLQVFAGDLLEDLQRADPRHLQEEQVALVEAVSRSNEASEAAKAASDRLADMLSAQESMRKRDAVNRNSEDLLASRDAAVEHVRALETQLAEAQARADTLASALEKEGGVAERLARAGRTLRIRRSRRSKLSSAVEAGSQMLGVEPVAPAVAQDISRCEEERRRLSDLQRGLDSAGEVRGLLEDMLPALRAAAPHSAGTLLADGFVPELTVEAAYASMSARHLSLINEPTPQQVRELLAEISTLSRRREALELLSRDIATLARADELFAETVAEYNTLEEQAENATETAKASREADGAVGGLQSELTAAHSILATLNQQIAAQGTVSRTDADHEVQALTAKLGISESELANAEPQFRRESADADAHLESTSRALASARRRVTTRTAEISQTIARINQDPRYRWINTVTILSQPDGAPDLEAFEQVRDAILAAASAIQNVGDMVDRLEGICRDFLNSRAAEPSELDAASQSLAKPVSDMLASSILQALNSPSVQKRVFGGGTAVGLDPVNRNLTLRWESGAEDVRPMAGFSTGEQAFAFTQARILDITPSSKPNRLLVLDEFGAFVSADRLPDLAAFLSAPEVEEVANQVLVILPLHVNYELEVEHTTGTLRKSYEMRLAQIRERDYCAVPL